MTTSRMPIGAEIERERGRGQGRDRDREREGVRFRVYAPTHSRVTLVVEHPASARTELVLEREPDGQHHSGFIRGLGAGATYRFKLGDDAFAYPDPAARYLPEGPFGPSEVIDPTAFTWTDDTWRGIPATKHVLYELHLGTFTPEGTWNAAADSLPYLAELGITTLEIMPINAFAGRYNWGYDGVNLFAPNHTYGTPDDMRRFVDRAHACGIAVILDVVYNHLGPSGNYLFAWAPDIKHTERNDWGDVLDFSSAGLREHVVENAAYWIREFHLDGLRLDATQAIIDDNRGDKHEHILAALTRRAREAGEGRHIFVVAENEPQDSSILDHGIDALWNDDFHHTARVAVTGVADGYIHDYHGTPQELLSAIKRGFLYQGQLYPWQRNTRGSTTRGRSRASFVHFLENHDQVANVGFGERLSELTDPATLRAMTALVLLSPQLPMLFQGQEYGAKQRWHFFVDHTPDLHEPIRKGRRAFEAQFARLATAEAQAALVDPNDETTFTRCILDPRDRKLDHPLVALHRDLLRLRRDDPAFTDARPEALDGAIIDERVFALRWFADDPMGDRLMLVNLGPSFSKAIIPEPLIASPTSNDLKTGWRVLWSSEDTRYGGHGTPPPFDHIRLALPAHATVVFAPDRDAVLRIDPPPPSGDQVRVEP